MKRLYLSLMVLNKGITGLCLSLMVLNKGMAGLYLDLMVLNYELVFDIGGSGSCFHVVFTRVIFFSLLF